ncbi:hypothetical protein LshimejAT787_0300370 [Lyophyllum shimeji]|uniref:DUF6535 domain-containing protein n=1 Tax=Lyophyllum shimeji TaxID=47721 RepID=A0A9P3PHV1_LYOSH|nr:hypothetical protein LshimejAT787_0300370 [Lyophyllum shimeji]
MADDKTTANQFSAHDDPSTRIWSSYISGAEKYNRDLARSWKGDMDAILIFAGLFSASVTAFIIESYKTLSPAPQDTTNALLAQISRQLAAMSNTSAEYNLASVTSGSLTSTSPVPSTSTLTCNILWFLSLGSSLASALSATLVEQWVRNYLQATESRPVPHERARICAYLHGGLEKFKMGALVEAIPMLLHVSLLLFFAGLAEFLRPVSWAISYLTVGMLITCIMLYGLATIVPVYRRDCPYQTPLSGLWWKIMQLLRRVLRNRHDVADSPMSFSSTMAEAREAEALAISPERDQRDFNAMTWTLENLRHESEFEAFVEVIPRVVAGFDYSAKLLLHRLFHHPNLAVRLGHRIPRLLISCTGGILDPVVCQKRAAACLAAIWSLSMMAVPTGSDSSSPDSSTLRFDEFTLRDIHTVKAGMPGIKGYAISSATVIAQGLIDKHIERASAEESILALFTRGGRMGRQIEWVRPPNKADAQFGNPVQVIHMIRRAMAALEKHLGSGEAMASPITSVVFSAAYGAIRKLFAIVQHPPPDVNAAEIELEALKFVRSFLTQANQAGFSLALDYIAHVLKSRSLPYEAFNTFRRIFLKINFERSLSVESQIRFVSYLDDALELDSEGSTHMPQSMINIILGLTRAVDDPTCALKAKTIISRCMHSFPSEDEAQKALAVLDKALPQPQPTLDLFTSHMYSNIKLDKGPAQPHVRGPTVVADIAGVSMGRKHETA